MSRLAEGRRNLAASAEALLAFQRGEDSEDAYLGALMIADGLHCLRVVREFLREFLTGGSKKGGRG